MSGVEFPQLGISGMNGVQIQFRLERKVIEFGIALEQLEFDITAQSRKEMVGLSGHSLGR